MEDIILMLHLAYAILEECPIIVVFLLVRLCLEKLMLHLSQLLFKILFLMQKLCALVNLYFKTKLEIFSHEKGTLCLLAKILILGFQLMQRLVAHF